MDSRLNDDRSSATDSRERLTAVYAAFNHAVATQDTDPIDAAALVDDATWAEQADDSTAWAVRIGTAVAEHASEVIPTDTDHVQALPEQFAERSGTVIVTGAYVGTTADGSHFDVPFTHSYTDDPERGATLEQTTDTDADDAFEQQ